MNRSEKSACGTANVCAQSSLDHDERLIGSFRGRIDSPGASDGGARSAVGPAHGALDAFLHLLADLIAERLTPLVGAGTPRYADARNNPFGSERAFLDAARRGDFDTFPRCRRTTALWSAVEGSIESRRRKRKTPVPKVTTTDADREELEAAGVRLRPEGKVRR